MAVHFAIAMASAFGVAQKSLKTWAELESPASGCLNEAQGHN